MQAHDMSRTISKRAGRDVAEDWTETRSIDWLSRSPEAIIRVGRPAPSDRQLIALQAAALRLVAWLTQLRLPAFRRAAGPAHRIPSIDLLP